MSIVTPVLNRASMLKEMLASLNGQAHVDYEHIVIDGGSTDGSQAIAVGAGAHLIEAPGSTIYEALNLGLSRTSGEIVSFLNSDDLLAKGALDRAHNTFLANPKVDIARGVAIFSGAVNAPQMTAPLDLDSVLLGVPKINACFISKSFLSRVGPFDTRYKIAADREWLARALIAGAHTELIDQIVYIYRDHAGSLTIGPNKPATEKWVLEHTEMARALLARHDLSSRNRAVVSMFHAKETAHLAILALGRGAPRSALRALADGFRTDALWPLRAAPPLARIAARRMRRPH